MRATAGTDHRPFITLNHRRQLSERNIPVRPSPPAPFRYSGPLLARAAAARPAVLTARGNIVARGMSDEEGDCKHRESPECVIAA